MIRLALAASLICLSACGSDAPGAPSATAGLLHVVLQPQCASTITSATILIDGVTVGTITPGGPALKHAVALGSHTIAGYSTPARFNWSPSVRVLTASDPEFVSTFQCQ